MPVNVFEYYSGNEV